MTDINFTDNSQLFIDELNRRMPIILEAVGIEAAGNAMTEINNLVYDTPESPTYVRTGRLKNSIAWATSKRHASVGVPDRPEDSTPHTTPEENSVYIGTNVEYAPYVEFGTYRMPSRPFLRNAIEKYKDDYKKIMEEGLK